MMNRPNHWFSIIITRRTLISGSIVLVLVIAGFVFSATYGLVERSLSGVKPGVTLEGHQVSGLLEAELYDAVASIAETFLVEARNATYDWQSHQVYPEQVGQVIDVPTTVQNVLKASKGEALSLVVIDVIPSITQAHFTPYYQGASTDPKVSLMINVDWGNEFIPGMLATFAQYGVTTTWFPTGNWVSKSPSLAKQIADAGHELGNHGGWHGMPSKMSADQVRKLIVDGEDAIVSSTGQKPRLFAPPAGDMNTQTLAIAGELGYKTVLWTLDTIDWQRPAATVIIDRVVGRIKNGALILMHPTKPTAEALPHIIEQLQAKGYSIVTVSEVLGD